MIYWIQRKRLITILVLGTRWITIKVYKILKEFKGIDFQGKATFYLLSYFKFEFPKVIKSFFNPMNFTSSQFVLSSSNFYLTQHSLIYIQNKFYSSLIITCFFIFLYLFIYLFFWEVEALYTIYKNHTFTMVTFFHIRDVSKIFKWRHVNLERILEIM